MGCVLLAWVSTFCGVSCVVSVIRLGWDLDLWANSGPPSLPTTERSEGVSPTSEARREYQPSNNNSNKRNGASPTVPAPAEGRRGYFSRHLCLRLPFLTSLPHIKHGGLPAFPRVLGPHRATGVRPWVPCVSRHEGLARLRLNYSRRITVGVEPTL